MDVFIDNSIDGINYLTQQLPKDAIKFTNDSLNTIQDTSQIIVSSATNFVCNSANDMSSAIERQQRHRPDPNAVTEATAQPTDTQYHTADGAGRLYAGDGDRHDRGAHSAA
jgi:hypothetical protein